MRPVDADAIYNKALEDLRKGEIEDWEFDSIINYLDGAPTLNVETNMRCKDCINYIGGTCSRCGLDYAVIVDADDFCSRGVTE